MNQPVTAGLLPLYLKLYTEAAPEVLAEFTPFMEAIVAALKERGIAVSEAPVCMEAPDFQAAVQRFEEEGVDCIVTLHLAYSPSLESVACLAKTALPLLMLDTTMDAGFGREVDPKRIMYNHGIHGVQDLASMLRRRGKAFEIVAGHYAEASVMARAADYIRAAHAARQLRHTRSLRIGASFEGMGDFAVEAAVMQEKIGITVDQIAAADLLGAVSAVDEAALAEELAHDREHYTCAIEEAAHRQAIRIGLGLRQVLNAGGYSAFSMNFLAFDQAEGPISMVPFLEISKAMARGVGYGGEGDVLTASLVGALQRAFGKTTFTEIFCPDWQGNTIFLSHMGEISPAVAGAKPCIHTRPFPYTPAQEPAVLTCPIAPGPAVYVNLAPGPDHRFALLIAPVEVLDDATHPAMQRCVRAWIQPAGGIAPFLEWYSRHGGTHHSALVLGEKAQAIAAFGRMAGLEVAVWG